MPLSLGTCPSHELGVRVDVTAVVDGASADDQFDAEGAELADVVLRHSTVEREHNRPIGDQLACLGEAPLCRRDERLTSPAGVDREDKYELQLVEQRLGR